MASPEVQDPGWGIRKVHYVVGVVEVLLAIRFVLMLFAANSHAFFSGLVYTVTDPLVAPFAGVFSNGGSGGHIFSVDAVVAGIIYALLAWGIDSLLRMRVERREALLGHSALHTSRIPAQEPPPIPPSRDDSYLP